MPRPALMVYQPKGRKHVEYIRRLAVKIWNDTYGSREDGNNAFWVQSLKDAMTLHRNYLKTGIKLSAPKTAVTPPKEKGSFWRNPKNGIWMPMEFDKG